jgi:HTH-type transcriptional regulator/antitoxin HigA
MKNVKNSKKFNYVGVRPFNKMPRTFNGLCCMLPLRPIHDEPEYDNAIEMLDSLVGFDLNNDQLDYLVALTTLVGAYEDEHHAIDTTDKTGLDALKYLMEHNDMTASDLGVLLGNRSLGSKILRGERELSKTHLRILADRFKVDAGLFL